MTPSEGPHDRDSAPADRTDEPPVGRGGATTEHAPGALPPASVAEEAALLVDLLSRRGWPGSAGVPTGRSSTVGGPAGATGRGTTGTDEGRPDDAGTTAGSGQGEESGPGQCSCGGTTPSACRVCPVCQVVAVVQRVSPDTIERVADFVGFAASALRELATAQRERQAAPDENEHDRTGPEGGA